MFSLSQTAANTHAATENQQLNTYLLKRISVLLFFADTNMAFHCVLLISDELEFSVIVQGRLTEKRTITHLFVSINRYLVVGFQWQHVC